MFFGKKALPFLRYILCISLCPKSLIFLSSLHSTYSLKQFSLSKNVLQLCDKVVKRVFFVVSFHSIRFYSKNVVCFEYLRWYHCIETFGQVFQNNVWLYTNFLVQFLCRFGGFIPSPVKFSVVLNCLDFIITVWTVDLGIAN